MSSSSSSAVATSLWSGDETAPIKRQPPGLMNGHAAHARLDRKLLAPKVVGLGDGHWTLHFNLNMAQSNGRFMTPGRSGFW